jgi:hypothetical protein
MQELIKSNEICSLTMVRRVAATTNFILLTKFCVATKPNCNLKHVFK